MVTLDIQYKIFMHVPKQEKIWKTLWKKEKMMVPNIFFFSNKVFYLSETKISIVEIFLYANDFNLDWSKFSLFSWEKKTSLQKGLKSCLTCYREALQKGTI